MSLMPSPLSHQRRVLYFHAVSYNVPVSFRRQDRFRYRLFIVCGAIQGFPHEFLFVYQQFIAFASNVHDADAWVGFETAAEFGDEYLKAAGVEEVVVAPDFQKERSCVEGLSFACTKKFEDLCLAWRKFFGCAGMIETEYVRMECEFTDPVCLRSRSGLNLPSSCQ